MINNLNNQYLSNINNLFSNISETEKKLYFWIKSNESNIPRDTVPDFLRIISSPNFEPSRVPSEYRIKQLDFLIGKDLFKLTEISIVEVNLCFLPVIEVIFGMLKNNQFCYFFLMTNGFLNSNLSDDFIFDIWKAGKFQNVISNSNDDTLFISIIAFSDDFAKAKKARWCPIDALYLAFGNLPLIDRFKHENIIVFSIMDNFSCDQTLLRLRKSIDEFNELNYEYFFPIVNKKFKIKAFLQLIACDDPEPWKF